MPDSTIGKVGLEELYLRVKPKRAKPISESIKARIANLRLGKIFLSTLAALFVRPVIGTPRFTTSDVTLQL